MNPNTNTRMLRWKSKICLIIYSSINFYLFHVYNDVQWAFFQIQNNWRPKKLKKGKNAAWIKKKQDQHVVLEKWNNSNHNFWR